MSSTETLVESGTWQLDPVHSTVGFEVSYLAGTFRGEFREVSAEVTVDGERAHLEGSAKVASIDVKDDNLATHLQSPDFFDAERHPELSFSADDIDLTGSDLDAHGEITIKGVTRPVDVSGTVSGPMFDPYGRERIGLQLSADIDRTTFGVSWNNPLPNGEPALANDVRIVTELQFVRSA